MKQVINQQLGQSPSKVYLAKGAIQQQNLLQNPQNNGSSPKHEVQMGSGMKSGESGAFMNYAGSAHGMNNSIDLSSSRKERPLIKGSNLAKNGTQFFPSDLMTNALDQNIQYQMQSPQVNRIILEEMLRNGNGATKDKETAVAMMMVRDAQEQQQRYENHMSSNNYNANLNKINTGGRLQKQMELSGHTLKGRVGSDGLDFGKDYLELLGDARIPQESLWPADFMREMAGSQLLQSSNNSLMSEQEQVKQLMMQIQKIEDYQQYMGAAIEGRYEIPEVMRSEHRMMHHNQIMANQTKIIAYTCPEAQQAIESGETERYINEHIEEELIEFKAEIEKNFEKSEVNKKFKFQRITYEQSKETAKQVREVNRIVQNNQNNVRKFSKAASPSVRLNKIQVNKPETAGAVKIVVTKQIESTNLSPAVASPSTVQAASLNMDATAHQSMKPAQIFAKQNEKRANKLISNSQDDTEELVVIDDQNYYEKANKVKINQQIMGAIQISDIQGQNQSNQLLSATNQSNEAVVSCIQKNQSKVSYNKSACMQDGQSQQVENNSDQSRVLDKSIENNQNMSFGGLRNQTQTQQRNHKVAIPSNSTSYNDDQREFARENNNNINNKTFQNQPSSTFSNNKNTDLKSPENRSKTVISNQSNNNSSIKPMENRDLDNIDNSKFAPQNLQTAIKTIVNSDQDNSVIANRKSNGAGVNVSDMRSLNSQSRANNPNLTSQSSVAITKSRLNSKQDKQHQQANARLRQSQGQSVVASSNQNIESIFKINQVNNTRQQRTNLNQTQSIVTSNNRRRLVGQSVVITQNRTPNTDVIGPSNSHGGPNINQLRRSQKVGLVKNRAIQHTEDAEGQQRNTDEQSNNYNHQQMPQRAFRRGPRGAAGLNVNGHAKIVNIQRSGTANQNFNKYFRHKGNNNIFSGNSGGLTSKHSVSRTRKAARALNQGVNSDPKSPGFRGSEMRNTNPAIHSIEHNKEGQNSQNHRKHLSTLEYTQTLTDMTACNTVANQKLQEPKNGEPKPNYQQKSNEINLQTFKNFPQNDDGLISQNKSNTGGYSGPSQIINARGVMLKSTLNDINQNPDSSVNIQNNRRKQRTVSAIPSKTAPQGAT